MPVIAFLFVIGLLFLIAGIRVINQYERGVVLTLGKYSHTKTPGLSYVVPIFQRMIRVDIRITTSEIPQQEVITKDNVPVGINAVVYFLVEGPEAAVLSIQNYAFAVNQYAQTALRDVIGGFELDTLLSARDKIADEIKVVVEQETKKWGIDVTSIRIQDIELPADMKRVMAKQAEAEREKRAVIIKAEGELIAAENLGKAAGVLMTSPGALSLRTLGTIEKINPDPSKTIIFALPVEILEGFKALAGKVK
ncbi:MAG: slipin family protein [bacterium]|nr:slipin family protein [bacterium]